MSGSMWLMTRDAASQRPYYYKTGSTETLWIKPDELLTPPQLATGWAETTHTDGRSYWFRKDDKSKTSWTAPPGWNDAAPEEPPQFAAASFQQPPRDLIQRDQRPARDEYRPYERDRPYHDRRDDGGGYRGPTAATPAGKQYANPVEAEAAFGKVLKKAGVQSGWTYEQTLRATIQDPEFRAIAEPHERRAAFERFQDDLIMQDKERERDRLAKLRNDFRTMLARHPEIKHYTRWKTARTIIQDESTFRSTSDEEERKAMFREYIADLRQKHEDQTRQDHEDALNGLTKLLRDVSLSPEMRWEDAHSRLQSHSAFADDDKYQTLTRSEVLETFVTQVRHLWDDVNTIKQHRKHVKARQQRKARDGFLDLLQDLQDKELLKPDSLWKDILPLVEQEPQYQALLDNVETGDERLDGSNAQDLFFDTLEDLERELYQVRTDAELVMQDTNFRFRPKTSLDEFIDVVTVDKRIAYLKRSRLEAVYKRLQQSALEREEDVVRDEKRQQRKAIDALRSRIKRLNPPVEVGDSWEAVRARLESYSEYDLLPGDEDRRAAFDKHMRRLEEDAERDRAYRRERDRDRDDHRRHESRRSDRERNDRRRSRSPAAATTIREMDAYEADRRRAVEQRERQYRHASNGLSPAPPARDRRPRDDQQHPRRGDAGVGGGRARSLSRYDRERLERDKERERAYISRADPYAKAADLDYGDSSDAGGGGPGVVPATAVAAAAATAKGSRPASSHGKRAGSEGGEKRAVKRARTDKGSENGKAEGLGAAGADAEEVVALQSGSEEGEIEEV